MNEDDRQPSVSEADRETTLIWVILSRPGSVAAEKACSQLLGAYRERVYLWCFRYVRNHEKALDMSQEVLFNAYRSLSTYEERNRFGAWLFTIARNRCLSELRRPTLLVDDDVELNGLVSPGKDPHQALEEKLTEEALLALIERHLEPTERKALWLRCMERLPVDTITTLLGIRERSGARAVLQRARRKLRAVLAREGRNAEGGLS